MLRNLLGTGERRNRDEGDIGLRVVPDRLQEQGQLFNNLVVSRDNMLVSVMLEMHESQVVTHRALSHATVAISMASSQREVRIPKLAPYSRSSILLTTTTSLLIPFDLTNNACLFDDYVRAIPRFSDDD
jgi:hypothetical protein